jgi:opacity protein-like surface antigen
VESHWSVGVRAGAGVPRGTFDTAFDPGFSVSGDVEYAVTGALAVGGEFGFNRFSGTAMAGGGGVDLIRISGRVRAYVGPPATRMFAAAGAGLYRFDPGSNERGTHVGVGLIRLFTSRVGVEATYNYHVVNTTPDNTTFHTVEAGVRIRF